MMTTRDFRIAISGNDPLQRSLEKTSAELKKLIGFDERKLFEVNLILDEICTNIFEHNTEKSGLQVEIRAQWGNDILRLTFCDNGSPFNPTTNAPPDTTLPLEERRPGGLGLLLVRNYSQKISYKRTDGCNRTTIEKKLK